MVVGSAGEARGIGGSKVTCAQFLVDSALKQNIMEFLQIANSFWFIGCAEINGFNLGVTSLRVLTRGTSSDHLLVFPCKYSPLHGESYSLSYELGINIWL